MVSQLDLVGEKMIRCVMLNTPYSITMSQSFSNKQYISLSFNKEWFLSTNVESIWSVILSEKFFKSYKRIKELR